MQKAVVCVIASICNASPQLCKLTDYTRSKKWSQAHPCWSTSCRWIAVKLFACLAVGTCKI